MKPGDILGFSSFDLSGAIINLATWGIPFFGVSHVGIVARHQGRLLLFESTTMNKRPCEIRGKKIWGAQAHLINPRIEEYNGKVWHYSLNGRVDSDELSRFLCKDLGKRYDFLGAARSALITKFFRDEDLNNLFCSEWVAEALSHLNVFDTTNSSRWSPNSLMRKLVRKGVTSKPKRIK